MRIWLATMVCGVALCLGVALFATSADARRGGGVHMGGHGGGHARSGRAFRGNVSGNRARTRHINRDVNINRNVNRNVRRDVNRKYVYRNGRRGYWRNGIWIVAPAVAGATYVASCAYEYNRWQSTGSSYWRDRYYRCSQ